MKLTALLFITVLTACSQPDANPVLTVEGGQVQGVVCDSSQVIVYKGIPYAAAPVGENRWRKPQPVMPWEGVLSADHFSAAAFQPAHNPEDGGYGREFFWQGDPEFSEDCLYLNIWTPQYAAGHPEKKLPVTVWIHGGGYSAGWGFETEMDGEAWAMRDVILVTINYRLGVFGYLSHPELSAEDEQGVSGNYGTYDQIAALKWVRNNIAQFGGDPDHVTLMGQSAGARSVKNLATSPFSKNLICGAIIQSGAALPMSGTSQEKLDSIGRTIMDGIGLTSLKDMRQAKADVLFSSVNDYVFKNHLYGTFMPHVDNVMLKDDFDTSVQKGNVADVPYLIGYTADDMTPLDGQINRIANARDSISPQKPVFTYLFARPLPGDGKPGMKGAFHSSELWFQFGTLRRSWRPFTEADYELSERMVDYWTNFAKYGNPNNPDQAEWAPHTRVNPYYQILNINN